MTHQAPPSRPPVRVSTVQFTSTPPASSSTRIACVRKRAKKQSALEAPKFSQSRSEGSMAPQMRTGYLPSICGRLLWLLKVVSSTRKPQAAATSQAPLITQRPRSQTVSHLLRICLRSSGYLNTTTQQGWHRSSASSFSGTVRTCCNSSSVSGDGRRGEVPSASSSCPCCSLWYSLTSACSRGTSRPRTTCTTSGLAPAPRLCSTNSRTLASSCQKSSAQPGRPKSSRA
mmetsp:Transcript_90353/g.292465  ORF Transcript_90353/g.292465 Transcript_90353/m.292465 type:complete len:229 (+) Transcript_90353:1070-1756(+)